MATAEALRLHDEYRGAVGCGYAFVCSVTCVRRTGPDPPPTATFTQIYSNVLPIAATPSSAQWDYPSSARALHVSTCST
jgi:hypothetical protein